MCSDECVRSESHKEECPYLQRLPELDHDSQMAVLAVVRTLLIRKHGGEPWENIGEQEANDMLTSVMLIFLLLQPS